MANPKMTKQWFTYAARDLKAAKLMMTHGAQFKNEIAFHIQQSIGKALKGFLVFHEQRPPKTHKLDELADLTKPINSTLSPLFRGAKRISKYAVSYRYPNEEEKPVLFSQVKADLARATKIYDRLFKEVTTLKTE